MDVSVKKIIYTSITLECSNLLMNNILVKMWHVLDFKYQW